MCRDEKFKEKLEVRAQYLWAEYSRILAELCAQAQTVSDVIDILNRHFHTYQQTNKKKLDPDSLREGYASCSAVAALLVNWWVSQTDGSAVFLIEDMSHPEYHNPYVRKHLTHAHVSVALLGTQHMDIDRVLRMRSAPVAHREQHGVYLYDWTIKCGIKPVNPNVALQPVHTYHEYLSYLRNRLVRFSLPTSTKAAAQAWASV